MNLLTKTEPCQTTQTTPRRTIVPRYEVREAADAFTLTAYVPGVERSSLETAVDGDNLTLVGRRAWTPPTDWTAVHREIPQADYRLVLELDNRINREAIAAELNQGVLTLTLPKAQAVKPRRIEIKG